MTAAAFWLAFLATGLVAAGSLLGVLACAALDLDQLRRR